MPTDPLTTARIIWGALLSAVALYYGALEVLLSTSDGRHGALMVSTLQPILVVVAVIQTVTIWVVWRRIGPTDRVRYPATPNSPQVLGSYVVCWALGEAIGLYGFVLGVLGRNGAAAVPFFLLAGALLLMLRPRLHHFRTG